MDEITKNIRRGSTIIVNKTFESRVLVNTAEYTEPGTYSVIMASPGFIAICDSGIHPTIYVNRTRLRYAIENGDVTIEQ